jgi:polysaccharide deacetylase family protein (PEP-CTERM system associated)
MTTERARSLHNAMTVDVEDYFQVEAFAGIIPREAWEDMPRRVEANTERLLDLFAETGVNATFFVLGWIAERHPALIRRIVAAGHELASHGHGHARVNRLGPEAFRADIRNAKRLLEDLGGVAVAGYRAPTFSLGPATPWAHALLAEEGYRYSSSTFPIAHDLYGMPDAPRFPFRPGGGALWEFPMTTLRLFGRNLPAAGGGYFRLLPYSLFRAALRRFGRIEQAPAIFYFHPWEIDAGQPRIQAASRRSRFRHYLNIPAMPGRLDRLLRDFAWSRMDRVFAEQLAAPPDPGPSPPSPTAPTLASPSAP